MRQQAYGILAICILATAAVGGPDWEEGTFDTGDAGSLPGDAQVPRGQPALTDLLKIDGSIDGYGLTGPADLEDMYLIYVDDPSGFSVFPSTTNVSLWLFNTDGTGLLAVTGASPTFGLTPISTDGSGAALTTPGLYFLAITPGAAVAANVTGQACFTFAAPGEVSGPDGPGGSLPLDFWVTTYPPGSYETDLTGIVFPPCLADVNLDGFVNVLDLLLVLTTWGKCPPGVCPADIDGDGCVDVTDLLEVISNWGQCNVRLE